MNEHATVAIIQPPSKGGTKLVYREGPPANGQEYSEAEKGKDLGYVVTAPSLPRWMSAEFDAALAEHNSPEKPEADLNLYAHDWFEKISYIPTNSFEAVQDAAEQIININGMLSHALSTGCSQVSARTRIQEIAVKDSKILGFTPMPPENATPYYAIVSKQLPDDPRMVTEITIAPLESRSAFVKSRLHLRRLADCYMLRTPVILGSDIIKRREAAFNAIKACQHTP